MDQQVVTAKARKKRQNISAFRSLLETPAVGSVTLPANARLAFRSVAGAIAGTTAATLTGTSTRTIHSPALAAGEFVTLDYAERDTVVTPASGFDVLIDIGLGKFQKIGGA